MHMAGPCKFIGFFFACGLFGGLAACTQVEENGPEETAARNWPIVGGDYSNRRFSALDQINTANIRQTGGAWTRELDGTVLGEPVVSKGRLFATTETSAYALNAATGAVLWSFELPAKVHSSYRGVGAGDEKIFVGLADGRVLALNEESGEQEWISGFQGSISGDVGFFPSGPTYIDDLLIGGLVMGRETSPGRIVALDADNGEEVWRFATIPSEGAGRETWPPLSTEGSFGGGNIWANGSFDLNLGLAYFSIASPTPLWRGDVRDGANLYASSIVALDIESGDLRWHFQITHHDIWDAGLRTPPILYDSVIGDDVRPAVAVMTPYGYLFQFDRESGIPIKPLETRLAPQSAQQKTAPAQPFPDGGDNIGPDCVREAMIPSGFEALCIYDPIDFDIPNGMYPLASIHSAPVAYSLETKTFHASGAIWPFWLRRFEGVRAALPETAVPGTRYAGLLAALHGPTNSAVYEHEGPYRDQQRGAGVIVTAGGLLFLGETDGFLSAYESDTGEKIWRFQTGAPITHTAATYELGDHQYVAVPAGDTVWAFRIGGTLEEQTAPAVFESEATFSEEAMATDEVIVSPQLNLVFQDVGPGLPDSVRDEYAFYPRRIRVHVGEQVTWTNEGQISKTIAAEDGAWTAGLIAPGETGSVRFATPGTYTYLSEEHPFMLGQIIVEDPAE